MIATDACVFPYPEGDSSVRRMALEAGELGFDSIVAICPNGGEYFHVRVIPGVILREPFPRQVRKRNREDEARDELSIVEVGEGGFFSRSFLNVPGVSIIRRLDRAKNHSFDHVAARIAADRGIAVDFDLSRLVQLRGGQRQRVIARFSEILRLQRRYEFAFTVSSGAKSILEQRTVRELTGLCSLFGMGPEESHSALSAVTGLLAPREPVRMV
jgi:ribonuclease P/MRP protein subunit RPP1